MRYSDNDIIVHSEDEYDDDEDYHQGGHQNHHLAQQTLPNKTDPANLNINQFNQTSNKF